MPKRLQTVAVALGWLGLWAPGVAGQELCPATICFDGGEAGVNAGASTFSFQGSNWSGGRVATLSDRRLYTSGFFAYVVAPPVGSGLAEITFDEPVTDVEFSFQHGGLFSNLPPATATSFDVDDLPLETIQSVAGMGAATPHVAFDPAIPITRITFDGGTIDSFSFTPVPEPGPATWIAFLTGLGWLGRRAQRRQRNGPLLATRAR